LMIIHLLLIPFQRQEHTFKSRWRPSLRLSSCSAWLVLLDNPIFLGLLLHRRPALLVHLWMTLLSSNELSLPLRQMSSHLKQSRNVRTTFHSSQEAQMMIVIPRMRG
jgi:hypothetical protein